MTESKDRIEFYNGDKLLLSIASSMVPPIGSYINIKKVTWRVLYVSFSIDHSDNSFDRSMRCNVELEEDKP